MVLVNNFIILFHHYTKNLDIYLLYYIPEISFEFGSNWNVAISHQNMNTTFHVNSFFRHKEKIILVHITK